MSRGFLLALMFVTAGCNARADGPLRAVVIGHSPRVVDPNLRPLRPEDAVLMGAVAEGLVRLDAGGQIVPGLAIRWSVSDDGLSYIFRLGDRRWNSPTTPGTALRPAGRVTAAFVARRLRAAVASGSRNPLAPVLTGIEEIVATTEEVLEIRLAAPRPNLLHHLARPELDVVRDGAGAGPLAIESATSSSVRLTRTVVIGEDERIDTMILDAGRAALGVALFDTGAADVVLGGTLGDLPMVRAARPRRGTLRFDPAAGLLGLAVVDARGPLGRVEVRRALAMAIDRDALVAAFEVPGLAARTTLTPAGLSNLPAPAIPYWAGSALPARQAEARRLIGAAPVMVRVAMPDGHGYRLLFAHLARDWAAVGVRAVRVDMRRDADLRLVDAVAPGRGAAWYLERFACARAAICDPVADAALAGARTAKDVRARTTYFAEAERALSNAAVFVPLTAPLRWSLVAPRVTGWAPNPQAVHGLPELLNDPRD